jgi:hypothetical protein
LIPWDEDERNNESDILGRDFTFDQILRNHLRRPDSSTSHYMGEDKLLNSSYSAVRQGTYKNDPTYPLAPTQFSDPVINVGPDADKILDPVTGGVIDASDTGRRYHGKNSAVRC